MFYFFCNFGQLNGIALQNFSLFIYLTSMFHSNVFRLEILPLINDVLRQQISSLVFTWRLDLRSININKGIFVQSLMFNPVLRTLDFGVWTLDPGRWSLDVGLWTLDSKPWTLDSRQWTPDAERQTVDVKTLKFKTAQSFGNNGSISITSFLNSTSIKIFGYFRYENLSTFSSF